MLRTQWWRCGLWAVCLWGALAAPVTGSPWIQINDYADWWEALHGDPPNVSPVSEWEWGDYMYQWANYLVEGEPYPPTQFLPAELYAYEGGAISYPEEPGLVMVWGTGPDLPPGEYASAWKYDYLLDPDLSNTVITVSVFPPQWGPTGQITQVSFGIRDAMGRTRSWYWNVGPAATIPWNVTTPITIFTSQTGLNATIPAADGYMNTPGFDITTAQFFLADENAQWVGGPVPVPPPGGPPGGLWNYWHELQVLPQWELVKWYQPPDPAQPESTYLGWNEFSAVYDGGLQVADDWVSDGQPVTGVRWWGCYLNWKHPYPPPQSELPYHYHIGFYTDVPPSSEEDFSHPGQLLHLVGPEHQWDYTIEFVGWEYDPRINEWEACFEFEMTFPQAEWFYPAPNTIYWVSIAGCYG